MTDSATDLFWLVSDGLNRLPSDGPNPPPPPPPPPSNLTRVPTKLNLTAQEVWRSFGVCTSPHRKDTNYAGTGPTATDNTLKKANIDGWANRLHNAHVSFCRGHYNKANNGSMYFGEKLTGWGDMKWLCEVVNEAGTNPSNDTQATVQAEVLDISANNATNCIGIEGPNEPNHNRTGGTIVPADWAAETMAYMQTIWDTARSKTNLNHIEIVSTALQDENCDNSYEAATAHAALAGVTYAQVNPRGAVAAVGSLPTTGRAVGDAWLITGTHSNYIWNGTAWKGPYTCAGGYKHWAQMKREGMAPGVNCDYVGMHCYATNGGLPQTNMERRLLQIDEAFGDGTPVWMTEWGTNDAVQHVGASPTWSETAAGFYGPRAVLMFISGYGFGAATPRKLKTTRFDALDQYDPTYTAVQDHFGIIGISQTTAAASYDPTTWYNKPELTNDSAILAELEEPWSTADYTASATFLNVDKGANANVQWCVTTDAAGVKKFWAWNNVSVFTGSGTPANRKDIVVGDVTIKITDADGQRDFTVKPRPTFTVIAQ